MWASHVWNNMCSSDCSSQMETPAKTFCDLMNFDVKFKMRKKNTAFWRFTIVHNFSSFFSIFCLVFHRIGNVNKKARKLKVNGKLRMLLLMKNILNGEKQFLFFCFVRWTNETQTIYYCRAPNRANNNPKKLWEKLLFASKLSNRKKFNISQRKGALNWWQAPTPLVPSCHNHTRCRPTKKNEKAKRKSHKPENSFSSVVLLPWHWRNVCARSTQLHTAIRLYVVLRWAFSLLNLILKTFFIRLLNCL